MKKIFVLLLCLLGSASLWAQENTVLGTGALSQATTPKYAIKQIQVAHNNGFLYSLPTLDFGGATINWDYLDRSTSGGELYIYGSFRSTIQITQAPSIVGGHGSGAQVGFFYEYDYDGTYYYYETECYGGTGYGPTVTLSSSVGSSFYMYGYISNDGILNISYDDSNNTNLYLIAPTVNVSFGDVTATAVLQATAANAQNTAIGYQALYSATSSDNVAIGIKSGFDLTTGKQNTFIGAYSGKGITTGSGNTVLGATTAALPTTLSNSVLLADGNGNNRMYFTPNGNALIGFGNTFTDNNFRLDVQGNGRFTGKVQAQGIDGFEAVSLTPNKILDVGSVGHKRLYQMPTSRGYHDVLAFNKKGYSISYEESSDKVNFSPATLDMGFFAQKAGTAAQKQIINGSSVKAVRWIFSGAMYTNSAWMSLDYGWCNGTGVNVKIEHSTDKVTWMVNHTSDYVINSSGIRYYHFLTSMETSNYFRITITQNWGDVVRLSGIKLLTTRLGNQGAAPENAYPYTWNKDGWIGINKGIAEPEYPLDVAGASRLSGTVYLNEPVNSTGAVEILTRNTSTGAIEKIGAKMHKPLDWINYPGANADLIEENTSSFTYANNAPFNGYLGHFGNGGYGLQMNTSYFNNGLAFRSRNGDNASWNTWKTLVHEGSTGAWNIDVSGSSTKWNNNTFDLGEVANPTRFITGIGNAGWGYSSANQLKTSLGLPTSGGYDLQGSTARGNVTTNQIIAQSFGVRYQDGGTYQTIGVDGSGLGTVYRSFITQSDVPVHRFQGSESTDLFIIKNGGNVGIGISNPLEKLAVNGRIRAREVKVEPTNGWPDYVFEDSYKPLSLAEISTFVKKHKHLPEVPSAKEIAENGLELGEMNKILLKKVEELTLHLIQKDKQLAETNSRLDQLAKQVEKLINKK